jgi:hypothetical protein
LAAVLMSQPATGSSGDNFKDSALRLMAQVTARGVKRGD